MKTVEKRGWKNWKCVCGSREIVPCDPAFQLCLHKGHGSRLTFSQAWELADFCECSWENEQPACLLSHSSSLSLSCPNQLGTPCPARWDEACLASWGFNNHWVSLSWHEVTQTLRAGQSIYRTKWTDMVAGFFLDRLSPNIIYVEKALKWN